MPKVKGVGSGMSAAERDRIKREDAESNANGDFISPIIRAREREKAAKKKQQEALAKQKADQQAEIDRLNAEAATERKRIQDNANVLQDTVSGTDAEIAIGTAASDAVLASGQKNKRKRGGGKEQGKVVGGVNNSGVGGL